MCLNRCGSSVVKPKLVTSHKLDCGNADTSAIADSPARDK